MWSKIGGKLPRDNTKNLNKYCCVHRFNALQNIVKIN